VLGPDLYDRWLDPSADAEQLLVEARARAVGLALDVYPTNPLGNNVRFEGPEVVERFDPTRLRAQPPKRAKAPALPPAVQQSLFGEPQAPPKPARKRARS
jgi:hypothetical protein